MSVSAVSSSQNQSASPADDDYVVKSGDTLSGIAERAGVSLSSVIAANPQISNPHVLRIGQSVTIPDRTGPSPDVEPRSYAIRAGDTLSSIGDKFNLDWRMLAQQNGISNPNLIRPGQVLSIDTGPATANATVVGNVASPATALSAGDSGMSEAGVEALYNREAQAGVSNRPHWPGGSSGVTVGPGYDLGGRSAASVITDLTSIGVDRASAERLAVGAGLKGTQARDFVADNKDAVNLTATQERALLDKAMVPYAAAVKDNVKVAVTQNQFDAMVSFAYNIGVGKGGFPDSTVLRRLNAGDSVGAGEAMAMWNKSDGRVNQGLINRRESEIAQFNRPSGPANLNAAASTTVTPATTNAPAGSPAAYAAIIQSQGSAQAKADLDAGRAVLLGVRSPSNFTVYGGEGEYNDTMVIVQKSGDGYTAQTFRLNTEPSSQYLDAGRPKPPDVNGDGKPDLGQLQSGQTIQYQVGTFLNARALKAVGNQTNTVQRDIDGDGRITSSDMNQQFRGAAGMHIHIGGAADTYSMGCQTLPKAEHGRFFDALANLPQQSRFSYVLVDAPR